MTQSDRSSTVLTVLAIGMAATIGLGIARFAYALVLPSMRADLGWSYGEAGFMNTTNAVGYLLGAVAAARVGAVIGVRSMTLAGTFACVASLALCGALRDPVGLNAARILAGIGGALAFVGGGVLVTGLAARAGSRGGLMLGTYYATPGIGIALSGFFVPAVLEIQGFAAWADAWWVLAFICLPLALWLWVGSRGVPEPAERGRWTGRVPMPWLLTAYFGFGAGYIAYMTFMVAFVRDAGGGAFQQSAFWMTIGIGAVLCAWLWSGVLETIYGGRAFALMCALTATGTAVPIVFDGTVALFVSAALFGSTFFAVVATTTAFVRRNFPPEGWSRGIGMLTVAFGAGQIAGPVAVGWLNDWTGSLDVGLQASACLLILAALLALPQKDVAMAKAPAQS